jgi:hypothetical protein
VNIWIENHGFGDAEVYVDGLLSYRLTDCDRSFNSAGVKFSLVSESGQHLGYVTRADDTVDQIARLIGRSS